jgi:hypothetical protein
MGNKPKGGDRLTVDIEGIREEIEQRASLNRRSLGKEVRFLLQLALDKITQDRTSITTARIKEALFLDFTQEERAEIAKAAIDAMSQTPSNQHLQPGLFYQLLSGKNLAELSRESRIPLDRLQAIADRDTQRYPEDIDLTKLEAPLGISLEKLIEVRSATFGGNGVEEREAGGKKANGV